MLTYRPEDFIADNPVWRYQDFAYRANQIAYTLQQQHIQAVAVWFEDAAKLACFMLAAWQAKVRLVFPPNLNQESITWLTQHSQILLTDMPIETIPPLKIEVVDFVQFGQGTVCNTQQHFQFPNDVEIWLQTSGSTGKSKTIIKTAQQLWLGAKVLANSLPLDTDNHITAISTVSIQHIYGLTVHIMMSLAKGWQIDRKQQYYPESVFATAQQSQQAVLISSPTLLSHIDWAKQPPHHYLLAVISSGGALAESLSQQIRQTLQKPVIEIYGSTETGPIAIRDDIQLWQPLPDSQLGCSTEGTLWIEGAWLGQREQTADVVEFHNKGFKLLGRNDRIVKLSDKRISLIQVENQLQKHLFVDDCYIAPHPQQDRLAAWVALTPQGIDYFRENGRNATLNQLKQSLQTTFAPQAIPRFWRLTDKLPRNSQAKINKLQFNQICIEQIKDPIWLEKKFEKQTALCCAKVPLELIYLKDHFAQFPLVPGVIELQWIQEQINTLIQKNVVIQQISKLKFQKFLRPNDIFELTLTWQPDKHRVIFTMLSADEICCSGIAHYTE
ncbi:class I adenylate-forming enzyme family protein [Volucribacter amazonae]|uniref:AMP-binding protein n=1 Tax=Volucribacter amazonae TaxID=256731 RepID=A0A9X4SLK5_9PAST|nr:class I adenylate-forming enzyme family protein [Volucribacter amazonae]MDG6896264.1 AMP-binding protein [Volucribacter amazonae]